MMTLITFHSDKGPRDNLEDAVHSATLTVFTPEERTVTTVVLADGMGGYNCGEVASAIVIQQVMAFLAALFASMQWPWASQSIRRYLVLALNRANRMIVDHGKQHPEAAGLGTTAVCAVVVDDAAYVAWVGDSRLYHFHDGQLTQITCDHSEVQRLIDQGLVDPEDARQHPLGHMIYRYVGQPQGFEVDTCAVPLESGDRLLLATDGLTDVLTDDCIARHMTASTEDGRLDHVPANLVQEALAHGTTDNVTVLLYEHSPVHQRDAALQLTRTDAYPYVLARALGRAFKELDHESTRISA